LKKKALNPLKKLASQTVVYGVSHTLGRLINFLLVPLYTSLFASDIYGIVAIMYSVVAMAMVMFTYGMETAFFNFSRQKDSSKVFSTGIISVTTSTIIILLIWLTFSQNIANYLETPEFVNLVKLMGFILAFDALNALPLAKIRQTERPLRFSWVKLTNIGLNILFNLYFLMLCPWLVKNGYTAPFYHADYGITYIFISNLIASMVSFVMLLPEYREIIKGFDFGLWKKMMRYAAPLILVGLAGVINETIDRVMLKKLLPSETALADVGKYSAFYKLSIFMTVIIQAFRYAAEPFFFDQADKDDPKPIYARVMLYFVACCSLIFLSVSMFVEPISRLIVLRDEYFQHPHVMFLVPILLLANLFLGINFNLNIWYKLKDKTMLGAKIAIGAAIATIALNWLLIPMWGIIASAIVTLVVYSAMAWVSYVIGYKHYPIPYNIKMITFFIASAVLLFLIHLFLKSVLPIWMIAATGLLFMAVYGFVAWSLLSPNKKT
jgi:O-antigen/teichoic acid export membrane protein